MVLPHHKDSLTLKNTQNCLNRLLENSSRVFEGLDNRHKNSVHETIKESGARDVIITKSSSGKVLVCEYADVYNHYTTRFEENEEFGYDASYMGADDYEDEYLYEEDDDYEDEDSYEDEDDYEEDEYYENDYRSNKNDGYYSQNGTYSQNDGY